MQQDKDNQNQQSFNETDQQFKANYHAKKHEIDLPSVKSVPGS